jgi:hypothetical protein
LLPERPGSTKSVDVRVNPPQCRRCGVRWRISCAFPSVSSRRIVSSPPCQGALGAEPPLGDDTVLHHPDALTRHAAELDAVCARAQVLGRARVAEHREVTPRAISVKLGADGGPAPGALPRAQLRSARAARNPGAASCSARMRVSISSARSWMHSVSTPRPPSRQRQPCNRQGRDRPPTGMVRYLGLPVRVEPAAPSTPTTSSTAPITQTNGILAARHWSSFSGTGTYSSVPNRRRNSGRKGRRRLFIFIIFFSLRSNERASPSLQTAKRGGLSLGV